MMGRTQERRGHWAQALAISLALHGAAAAAILDVLPDLPDLDSTNPPLPQIDITSLPLDGGTTAPVTLQPIAPDTGTPAPASTPAPATEDPGPTDTPPETILSPSEDMLAATRVEPAPDGTSLGPVQPVGPNTGVPQTIIAALPPLMGAATGGTGAAPKGSPAQNQAVGALVTQLRDRLAEPCLAAVPQTLGGDEVLLTSFGANDRAISDLFRDLSGRVDLPMTERSVLLDARQCPAVDFIRAATDYPALRLQVLPDASEISSGDRLTGRVAGIGGNQATLLLVDDNGVVQDLRRFTLQSGDLLQFDVPVHRVGGDRDTSQLLIALATPRRPDSIARLAGRLAQDVFPPLAAERDQALIGVAPIYVRAAP